MKKIKIYGKNIEQGAIDQFENVMKLDCIKQGVLLPDCHQGYVLPIGSVVASEGQIFPAFVGYDIGCGMCAFRTGRNKDAIKGKEKQIFDSIYRSIPCGEGLFMNTRRIIPRDRKSIEHTEVVSDVMSRGKAQIGTLGGGNHFIEISHDEKGEIRVIIHSGSRGVGHKIATHYMKLAKEKQPIDTTEREKEAEEKFSILKNKDLEKFEEVKGNYIHKKIKEVSGKGFEGAYGLDINSKEGQDYIKDMNFCLEFALKNRIEMMRKVQEELCYYINGFKIEDNKRPTDFLSMEESGDFINRNHNHAELRDGLWIHRKGATHSEKGMWGVIPGNMRDGSFIVKGLGNPDSLYSSSHGAGRVMSRIKTKQNVKLEDFEDTMKGITAKITEKTKDESPFAYKDIFEVMELQKDLVEVKYYLKPIINIKG